MPAAAPTPISTPAGASHCEPFRHARSSGRCYHRLPPAVQRLADDNFAMLRQDPHHPSLRLKKVGSFWSARVDLHYRVLARDRAEGLVWFWIGPHGEYDKLITGKR